MSLTPPCPAPHCRIRDLQVTVSQTQTAMFPALANAMDPLVTRLGTMSLSVQTSKLLALQAQVRGAGVGCDVAGSAREGAWHCRWLAAVML